MFKIQSRAARCYIGSLHYITLHYSYLEWPKYKTAKPLQYTGYRTGNGNS